MDCLLCRSPGQSRLICPDCQGDLPALPPARCPCCAAPSPESQICGQCVAHPPAYDRTVALYPYESPIDQLILALKFVHQLPLARFFGEQMLAQRNPPPKPIGAAPTLLMPVPLGRERLQARGFNQALEIARALSHRHDVVLDWKSLSRTRETRPQSALPWQARQKNLRHAFTCSRDLTGHHVIVVDDVMTTGATLHEVAKTLKDHGALSVENWVIARALKHHEQG